jgi:hypothetical protein
MRAGAHAHYCEFLSVAVDNNWRMVVQWSSNNTLDDIVADGNRVVNQQGEINYIFTRAHYICCNRILQMQNTGSVEKDRRR